MKGGGIEGGGFDGDWRRGEEDWRSRGGLEEQRRTKEVRENRGRQGRTEQGMTGRVGDDWRSRG